MSEYILETRGLTKEFKGFVAVSNVDLLGGEIRIRTPNGLGSTTQLRIDGNEALELADGLDLGLGGSLTNLVVANGTILCVNGDCSLDLPVQIASPFRLATHMLWRAWQDSNLRPSA